MSILVIDANRTGGGPPIIPGIPIPTLVNPKWRVAKMVADMLGADMTWRSPQTAGEPVLGGYDTVVFNRALPSIEGNATWIRANPKARLFHITNDYLVGGGALHIAARVHGKRCHVIANYPRPLSKVATVFAGAWTEVNLNALLYESDRVRPPEMPDGTGCVYYGAVRPERRDMFQKYLTGQVTVAQYPEECARFAAIGVPGPWADRIDWRGAGLHPWRDSLYLWNTDANGHYHFLTNRFYEALSYRVWPVFAEECRWAFERSGYEIPARLVVNAPEQIAGASEGMERAVMDGWRQQATEEQRQVLADLRRTILEGES